VYLRGLAVVYRIGRHGKGQNAAGAHRTGRALFGALPEIFLTRPVFDKKEVAMAFIYYTPRFPLSQHVACLWFQSGQTYRTRETILPTGTIELMINLGAAQKVVDKRDPARLDVYHHSWLAGLQTAPVVVEAVADTRIIGARFKPGGAYPFFDFPISELNNRIITMDLIWGRFIHQARERLVEAVDLSERFRLLEAMLLQKLRLDVPDFRIVRFAVDEIACLDSFTTIKALSEKAGVSQKHLISLFNKVVGVPPKLLQRIIKFNSILRTIDPAQPVHWAEIAHQGYYYDHAHFDKDFLAFSGLTPTAYLKLRQAFPADVLPQATDVNMVPID
jgi:AraC-like DNA-binding protein